MSQKTSIFYALLLSLFPLRSYALGSAQHLVQPGENPTKISRKQGVTLDELMNCNPEINPRNLQQGQNITLHRTYTIKDGDRLSEIAREQRLTLTELLDYNPAIKDEDEIVAGKTMAIPCRSQPLQQRKKAQTAKDDHEQDSNHVGVHHSHRKQKKQPAKVRFPSGLELEIVTDPKLVGADGLFYAPANSPPLLKLRRSDLSRRLSPHFTVGEFARAEEENCVAPYLKAGHVYKMGGDFYFSYLRLDRQLLDRLERLRAAYNNTLQIDEGYRPSVYNHPCAGGARRSMHVSGMAADIDSSDRKLYRRADALFKKGGVGRGPSIIHVDTRRNHARWNY
ncbi:MAG: LysM peptidoglycan-binding domain-containing protein [Candidatus Woesearchaeota archaeon]|nr:LysM peptidoglycan-binding domain-containing protein [Candidatus Woesearchaeota archaeon]